MQTIDLYPYQQAVLDSPYKNRFVVWGRHFGKTLVGLRYAQQMLKLGSVLYIVPNFKMAVIARRLMYERSRHDFTFTSDLGTNLYFEAADTIDPLSCYHDYKPCAVVWDEAEMCPYFPHGLFRDFHDANLLVLGTPHARRTEEREHWFRDRYIQALLDPRWDTFVPMGTPPHISDQTLEQWQREMLSEDYYNTQVLGEWLPNESQNPSQSN